MMKPGWELRFAEMQAEAREKAKPRPGERLYGLEDLLENQDLPDGTQMTMEFMGGLMREGPEMTILQAINAYVDHPNILRRRAERYGELWHGRNQGETR